MFLRVLRVGAPFIECGRFMQISSASLLHGIQFCFTLVGFTAMRSAVPFYFVQLHCHTVRCSEYLSFLCLATHDM